MKEYSWKLCFRKISACAAVVVAAASLYVANSPHTYAQVVYSSQDRVVSGELPESKPFISGDHMVWVANDEAGNEQVFYENLLDGSKKQITSVTSLKDSPKLGITPSGGVYIVWSDKRNFSANQGAWDLYGYDPASGQEWKLNSEPGMLTNFSIGGSDVVWFDNYTGSMIYYDLKTRQEKNIGKGRSPQVASGQVVFINPNDGGLSLYVLATGETRSILELPYHLNVIDLAFNGTYVLYKQTDLDWNTKYVMLNVTVPSAEPKDLTPASKKVDEYYQIYMGNNEAAWIQNSGGTKQLLGVNIEKTETHIIAQGEEASSALAINGDRILMVGSDHRLIARTMIRNVVPDSVISVGGGGTGLRETQKLIQGSEGGDISSRDGTVTLHIPAGALDGGALVELAPDEEGSTALDVSDLQKPFRAASKAWQASLGQGLKKNAQLSFAFDSGAWSGLQAEKMSIYRWDAAANSWIRVGGHLDAKNNTVTADVGVSGTYALLVNDVAFADTDGHWAQSYVEVLAAKDIVSGVGGNVFAPDDKLTRAQFAKMLLGAMGMKPQSASAVTFTDVPSAHWSAGWIAAAAESGLVEGDGGKFHPDDALTREEMVVMLVRALHEDNKAAALSESEINAKLSYQDAKEISGWARAYVAISTQSGLIEGDGTDIKPKASSTRAQAAAVIYRLLKQTQKL